MSERPPKGRERGRQSVDSLAELRNLLDNAAVEQGSDKTASPDAATTPKPTEDVNVADTTGNEGGGDGGRQRVIDAIRTFQSARPDTRERRDAARGLKAVISRPDINPAVLEEVVRLSLREIPAAAYELAEERLEFYLNNGEVSNADLLRLATGKGIHSAVVRQCAREMLEMRIQTGAITDVEFLEQLQNARSYELREAASKALETTEVQPLPSSDLQQDHDYRRPARDDIRTDSSKRRGANDPLYEGIKNFLIAKGVNVSPSFVQRHFRIPPDRIHAMLDALEAEGVLGPAGPKNRRRRLITRSTAEPVDSAVTSPEVRTAAAATPAAETPQVAAPEVPTANATPAPHAAEIAPAAPEEEDDRLDEAQALVIARGIGSRSHLSLEMKINYNRAERILEQLVKRGVLGPIDPTSGRRPVIAHAADATPAAAQVATPEASPQVTPRSNYEDHANARAAVRDESQKQPGDIARENREVACQVPELYECQVMDASKQSYDPLHQLLKRIAEDTTTSQAFSELGDIELWYLMRTPSPAADSISKMLMNYHDLLRERARLTDEFRAAHSSKSDIGVLCLRLQAELDDAQSPLHKYKEEWERVSQQVIGEQFPDEYAVAVQRGEVPKPQIVMQERATAVLSKSYDGLTYSELSDAHEEISETWRNIGQILKETNTHSGEYEELSNLDTRIFELKLDIRGRLIAILDRLFTQQANDSTLTDEDLSRQFGVPVDEISRQRRIRQRDATNVRSQPQTPGQRAQPYANAPQSSVAPQPPETPREWRTKLKELVRHPFMRAERSEDMQRRADYLRRRNEALNNGDTPDSLEHHDEIMRRIGETYQRLRLPWKIAIGAGLAGGFAVSASVSAFAASPFAVGIALHRGLGILSTYISLARLAEKRNFLSTMGNDKKRAALLMAAIGSSLVIGAGSAYAADLVVHHTSVGESALKLLRNYWPDSALASQAEQAPKAVEAAAPAASESAEAAQPPAAQASAADAGGAAKPQARAASAAEAARGTQPAASGGNEDPMEALREKLANRLRAAEIPASSSLPTIEASKGHGYEWMLKRMWEGLQNKGLNANEFAEESDIRQLLEADATTIDKVVHQIAASKPLK